MARLAATTPAHAAREVRVIQARQPGPLARLRELWQSRRLVVWFGRTFTERLYANTALGWWWVPLRPLLGIVPRALIFGGVLNAPSNGTPYLLFFLVGLGAWNVIDRAWYMGTRSLQMSAKYLNSMYLPRLVPVFAAAAPGLVELVLYAAFAVLAVAYMTTFDDGWPLDLAADAVLLLPAAIVLIVAVGISLSLWTAVLGTHLRDTRWTVRAVLGVWMLLTPVIYPLSAVPDGYRTAAELNPLTAPMEMIRTALFGVGDVTSLAVGVTIGFVAVVGALGLVWFGRAEATALDG